MKSLLVVALINASGTSWNLTETEFPAHTDCIAALAKLQASPAPNPLPERKGNYSYAFCMPLSALRVKPNGTAATRPLYDGPGWTVEMRWREIGRIKIGAQCEDTVIRATSAAKWYYATNDEQPPKRGLTVCE